MPLRDSRASFGVGPGWAHGRRMERVDPGRMRDHQNDQVEQRDLIETALQLADTLITEEEKIVARIQCQGPLTNHQRTHARKIARERVAELIRNDILRTHGRHGISRECKRRCLQIVHEYCARCSTQRDDHRVASRGPPAEDDRFCHLRVVGTKANPRR